ncbi:MAG: guanylate kinase [Planctomycetaceae bacterium]|jgi:guanylate kinase|nr:guanylate kinase [Planctomycetaceae bacterium]
MSTKQGKVVIISGPSGAGKSTLVRRLLQTCRLPLELSISATTRPPRPDELNGIDYHFLSADEFDEKRLAGEFLEYKEVFGQGYWYGTLLAKIDDGLCLGKWVILEIDVAGAMSVIDRVPDAITIFIHPGSMEELERRLRNRQTDNEEAIVRRLEVATQEMANRHQYEYQVINKDVDVATNEVSQILQALENH